MSQVSQRQFVVGTCGVAVLACSWGWIVGAFRSSAIPVVPPAMAPAVAAAGVTEDPAPAKVVAKVSVLAAGATDDAQTDRFLTLHGGVVFGLKAAGFTPVANENNLFEAGGRVAKVMMGRDTVAGRRYVFCVTAAGGDKRGVEAAAAEVYKETVKQIAAGVYDPSPAPAAAQPSLNRDDVFLRRWNAAAADVGCADYTWPVGGYLPHPTLRGGTREQYERFGRVVVQFLRTSEARDWVVKSGWFTRPAAYSAGAEATIADIARFASRFCSPGDTSRALAVEFPAD